MLIIMNIYSSKHIPFDYEEEGAWRKATTVEGMIWLKNHHYPCKKEDSLLMIYKKLLEFDRLDLLVYLIDSSCINNNISINIIREILSLVEQIGSIGQFMYDY